VSPRLALGIGAVAAFIFGVGLLIFPATMLTQSGLDASTAAIAASRGAGATLIGLAVIDWLGRTAAGDGLRAILVGNLVVQILSLAVNAGGVLTGQLPAQAGAASVIHVALGAVFALALRPARSLPGTLP
jgi:hypothetical protein